ncbi:MerR family transcriptional regulator [Flavobacterium terrigena]|uniref:Helix-turn-helix domain-containing protein n=1 Tax=Flavobacterium terrigena TaxID=402734 RepID=A0A1H6XQ37_9FLAO|nr:helix-turn-helix domain-containing protein [Flavobacterium terrigena]SEJ26665.1 hypothetical protein SAMN05660918_2803 [Flavobacterium terrigena]
MDEIQIKNPNTNHFVNQLLEYFADKVAGKLLSKLEESNCLVKTISISQEEFIENKNDEDLLFKKEVCELLKIKMPTLNSWRVKGVLMPDTYVGRSPRYKRITIERYLKNIA